MVAKQACGIVWGSALILAGTLLVAGALRIGNWGRAADCVAGIGLIATSVLVFSGSRWAIGPTAAVFLACAVIDGYALIARHDWTGLPGLGLAALAGAYLFFNARTMLLRGPR